MSDFDAAKKRLKELLEDYDRCPPVQTQLDIRLLLAEVDRLEARVRELRDAHLESLDDRDAAEAELEHAYAIRDNVYRREAMEHLKRAEKAEAEIARLKDLERASFHAWEKAEAELEAVKTELSVARSGFLK